MAPTVHPRLRSARDVCESAFAFLAEEFGYEAGTSRFRDDGFELGYTGPGLGVVVDWFPRDTLTVWLVRLVDGTLPVRSATAGMNYFELGDVEAVLGRTATEGAPDLYTPSEAAARHLAGRLRACGSGLRGGALGVFPELERRVVERARAVFDDSGC